MAGGHSQWWYREVSYSRKAGKGEEGVFSSFPTLTGKGWRNLLTTAFLQVGFFLSHLDQEQKSAYRQKLSLSALAWCGRRLSKEALFTAYRQIQRSI